MIAYCFRDGRVQVTDAAVAPEGSIELFRGPHRSVLRVIADTTSERLIAGMDTSVGLSEDRRIVLDYLETVRDLDNAMITVAEHSYETLLLDNEVAA